MIWGTRSSLRLRQWPRGSSRLVTVFLGTLWSSIKEVKPPFVFDVEHRIALEAMQGNRASSHGEGVNLMVFSSCCGTPGFPLKLWLGCSLNTRVFSATSGLLSSFQRHLGILLELWQGSRDASWGGRPRVPFQLPLGYWNSYRLSRGVRHRLLWSMQLRSPLQMSKNVKPPVEMRRGTRALSRVSTGHSDIPSCCERKHRLEFESLLGNQALPWVRAARCTFHLRQQTQGPSHITERSLFLRCLWKVGIPLESNPGNHLSSRDDLGYTELFSSCSADVGVPLDLGRCSRGISGVA